MATGEILCNKYYSYRDAFIYEASPHEFEESYDAAVKEIAALVVDLCKQTVFHINSV